MRKIYISLLTFIFISAGLQAQTVIFEDNFDSYTSGGQLADQAGSPWDTWSSTPGSAEDPVISDAQSVSPSNSANILSGNDCVLLLGDSTSGRYKISFDIYIPDGKLAYYNLLQVFAGGNSEWGTQTFFNADGTASTDAGGGGTGSFTFNYDEWFTIENYVDLDNDWADIFIGGEHIVSWKWTDGSFGGANGPNQLGAVNLYAWNEGGTPDFFVDDMIHSTMPLLGAPSNLIATVDGTTISLDWEAPADDSPVGYYVFRSGNMIGITTETNFEDSGNPGSYTYTVKAYYEPNGLSLASNEAEAEIAGGTDRQKVLLEIATGTWCTFCPGSAMGADDLIENGHEVAVIEYHNGDDYATAASDERNLYYDVQGFPTSTFDGISGFSGGDASNSIYDAYVPYYDARIDVKSLFGVTLDVQMTGRAYAFDVNITAEQLWDYSSTDLRLHLVLTESHIPDNWLGMTEVNFVCRDMYPNQLGQELGLENNGDSEDYNYEIEVPENYVIENCELVAFIQDNDTKEVLNAVNIDLGQVVGVAEQDELYSKIYPNPASDRVTIQMENNMKRVSIFSLNGQKVYELALDQNKVDMNIDFLESGIYMIQLETEAGAKIEKLHVR